MSRVLDIAARLDDDVLAWIEHGEQGLSSQSIVQHLTGWPLLGRSWGSHLYTPLDPDDLRRCRLVPEACPSLMRRFDEMRTASPTWAALVEIWDDLCELMDYESPEWRQGRGSAPETYEAIRRAEAAAS